MADINELKQQLENQRAKAQELIEKASSDTGLTDEDKVTLKEVSEETAQIVSRLESAKSDDAAMETLRGMFPAPEAKSEDHADEVQSASKRFLNSEQYKSATGGVQRGDAVPEGTKVAPVPVPTLFKSLVRGNGSPGADGVASPLLPTRRLGVVDGTNWAPRIFRDLLDVQESDSPLIEFIRQEFTNAAAETPEAESTSDDNAIKPESTHKWTQDSVTAKTIAHWEPVTRRMLNNAPQIAGIIETDLMIGLEDRLENQVVNGAGGTDLLGIAATSGIQSQAFTTDIFTTLLKARTKVRVGGRAAATAIVLDPESVESILLARENGSSGAFLYGGPAQVGALSVWGIPVVESEVVSANEAFVADWKRAKLYDVVRASIAWTDSHSDFFTRNIEVCRAEMDVALAVFRPKAFVQVGLVSSN